MTARRALTVLALAVLAQPSLPAAAAKDGRLAYSIAVTDEIGPSSAHELDRALADARRRRAAVVIVRLDTPGGLVTSMRDMIRSIAAAPMPVIVYVHPSGGHAESAGVPLTLAADVAAMAPETNIGSATPVLLTPPGRSASQERLLRDLRRKAINDTAALVRSLAEGHGRNADLAEQMVRRAVNVSATRARRDGLIDVVAPTEQALLRALDGFSVKGRKAQRLETSDLELKRFESGPAAADISDSDDLDDSSFLRSFVYVLAVPLSIVLLVVARSRGRPALRRWRRKRRRLRLDRRQ